MTQQDSSPKQSDPRPASSYQQNWGPILWLFMLTAFLYMWMGLGRPGGVPEISYSELKQQIRQDRVATITLQGRDARGTYRKGDTAEAAMGPAEQAGHKPEHDFSTRLPPVEDPQLLPLLEQHDVDIEAEADTSGMWFQLLVGFLPWVLILGLIYYSSRQMSQRFGSGGPFGFGKSKAKRFEKSDSDVSFDEVAGLENAKRDVSEIIEFLKDPARFRSLGARVPKGVLLMGPPGTGKTLLAKAVAGEANVPFFSISGSEFIELFVGVGASRVRDMFESAKKQAPAIIFIDEIDSVGRTRGSGLGGGHDEREQTLNQILAEMDGFAAEQMVVVIAATNRPDVLDPALLRPGRFDRKITLDLPRKEARRKILDVHARDVRLAAEVDLDVLAARTVGFSGADLQNLINEAALLAGRDRQDAVGVDALDRARDKIVLGGERETVLDDEGKKLVAFHESGHALLTCLLPRTDPLAKVTIIPRGQALGATEQLPEDEYVNLREGYLKDRITVMLGGRVAERVVFGEVSNGAENDLEQATKLARRMVARWGMSEEIGPAAFRRGEEHVFLGREMAQQRDFSEHTARLIDDEIRGLLRDLEKKATDLLEEHQEQLEALANALLEKEVLLADEIREVVGQ